ncbi:MAG: hypothetical protein U0235_03505 [Polyangiaceae bacterium]
MIDDTPFIRLALRLRADGLGELVFGARGIVIVVLPAARDDGHGEEARKESALERRAHDETSLGECTRDRCARPIAQEFARAVGSDARGCAETSARCGAPRRAAALLVEFTLPRPWIRAEIVDAPLAFLFDEKEPEVRFADAPLYAPMGPFTLEATVNFIGRSDEAERPRQRTLRRGVLEARGESARRVSAHLVVSTGARGRNERARRAGGRRALHREIEGREPEDDRRQPDPEEPASPDGLVFRLRCHGVEAVALRLR